MSQALFDTNPEWDLLTLGEVCQSGGGSIQTGPFGSQLHASDYVPVGVPSVMPQNIGDNFIREDGIARIRTEDAQRLSRYLLTAGDIVYSRRGDVERRALVRPWQDGWLCGTGCLRVRLGGNVDSRFIYYYLGHSEVRAWITRHAIGATMANLNTKILSALPVVLPSLAEQQAIAAVLGALDDKIAINERIADSALKLSDAVYDAAATSGRWKWISLEESSYWYSGGTPRTSEESYWGGDIPWISASSLKSPWIDNSDRNLTVLGAKNGTRLVSSGAVIFVVRGSSLNDEFRVGVTQREVAFGQDCKALIPKDGIDPGVLFHAMRHRTFEILNLVDQTGIGAGRLSTDLIAKLDIAIPATHGDRDIAQINYLDGLCAERKRESRTLAQLRDTLLPKLMSGEIRVKDAERVVEDAV